MVSNFLHVADLIDEASAETARTETAELVEAGNFALATILTRTKQGLDVDHVRFQKYSETHAFERERKGLAVNPVDLAMTGHMLGALVPRLISANEVAIEVTNPLEAAKLSAHDQGVDSSVSVRAHTRGTHVNKKGQRVSREEVRRDARRKNKRVSQRTESVGSHSRHMKLPKRELMDIRHPTETEALSGIFTTGMAQRIEKRFK